MRQHSIYAFLVAVGALTVLAGCRKQIDEPITLPENQPEIEMVNVRFNTFLKEGDNVRPLNVGTRMIAGEGTLANGFYLYGHVHKLPFATSAGNTYAPIFENVKLNADGTYAIPKFWLQDKSLLYSFQAYAATDPAGEVGPGPITIASGAPYVSSVPDKEYPLLVDVLGAAVFDLKIGDETPTVNLYFEHRLGKLSLQMQRMNAGGPTLYNLRMKVDNLYARGKATLVGWAPKRTIGTPTMDVWVDLKSNAITLPASDMTPIEAHSMIFPPQTLSAGVSITLLYTLEPGAVSASNPEKSLITTLDKTITLESGKQTNVVIGHIVESEQIIVQSVSLTDWSTLDKNVQEYK